MNDCIECDSKGYLLDQGYGCVPIPDEWVPVQRCDTCKRFDDDEAAARAAAANFTVDVDWFEPDPEIVADEIFSGGPGDWAINYSPSNLNLYRITWTELKTGYVRANSESAARQAWIDDDLDDIEYHSQEITELTELEGPNEPPSTGTG